MCVEAHTDTLKRVFICVCICLCVCVWVHMCACACVRMCLRVCVRVCTHTRQWNPYTFVLILDDNVSWPYPFIADFTCQRYNKLLIHSFIACGFHLYTDPFIVCRNNHPLIQSSFGKTMLPPKRFLSPRLPKGNSGLPCRDNARYLAPDPRTIHPIDVGHRICRPNHLMVEMRAGERRVAQRIHLRSMEKLPLESVPVCFVRISNHLSSFLPDY